MSELTVSMPAYNTGRFIGQAIESVLDQEGVDFELIVVDDGSTDNTAALVRSIRDPRLRLVQYQKRIGISYCHNLVIEESQAPYIMHVDSDDIVLPGAFRKMVDKLESDPRLGQVHCHFFDVDENGWTTREAFWERRRSFLAKRGPDMDYRRELLVTGSVINSLRTYRRVVFDAVGRFNESLPWGEDWEMALRILEQYEIGLVPEFLCCRRLRRDSTWGSIRFQDLRAWGQRFSSARRLVQGGQVTYLRQKDYDADRLLLLGLYHASGIPAALARLRGWATIPRRILGGMRHRLQIPLMQRAYDLAVTQLSFWPLDPLGMGRVQVPAAGTGVAYYLWHFPVLSETFIQREVTALRRSGLQLRVLAEMHDDLDLLDQRARALLQTTHYLLPEDENRFLAYRSYFRWKNPFLYLNLFLYVVLHRYGRYKNLAEDFQVFREAIYLAGTVRDMGSRHIHSPWADRSAFVALIASRLAGVTYSFEGRASDLHRRTHAYALREKLEGAHFVITNCHYNEQHIQSLLRSPEKAKIHVIYEGLDLERFRPSSRDSTAARGIRILTVARLIEEKGLVYLLRAYKILKDRGYSYRGTIIGSPQVPSSIGHYVGLKRLHKQLALEGYVSFLGAQPFNRVLEALEAADIFVLPCVTAETGGRDITPNALMEAMAMRLPVISTSQTAIPEIVEDGVSGLLIPPRDVNALTEAMVALIEDGALRRRLGEEARKRVEERFDVDKNILRYAALFSHNASDVAPRDPSG